jgi:hypothetical protein
VQPRGSGIHGDGFHFYDAKNTGFGYVKFKRLQLGVGSFSIGSFDTDGDDF